MRASNQLLSIPLIVFLTACGGGGGGGGGTTPPPAVSSAAPISSSSSSSNSSLSSSSSSSSSSSPSSSSSSSSTSTGSVTATVSAFLVVDQFGYLPDAQKIAVIRDPQTGYDADKSFIPSASLSLVNMTTGGLC